MKLPCVGLFFYLDNGEVEFIYPDYVIEYLENYVDYYKHLKKIPKVIKVIAAPIDGALQYIFFSEEHADKEKTQEDIKKAVSALKRIEKIKFKYFSKDMRTIVSKDIVELAKILKSNPKPEFPELPEIAYTGISPYILGTRA